MSQNFTNLPLYRYRRQRLGNLRQVIFTPVNKRSDSINTQNRPQFGTQATTDDFHNAMGDRYHRRLAIQSPNTTVAVVEKPKPSFSQWLLNSLLIMLIFAIVGLLIDFGLNIISALMDVKNGSRWLFFPILSVLGLVLGVLFGTRALDVIFGIFHNTPTENNPTNDDGSFSGGIMKAIGFALAIILVGWVCMMIFM